ncbi:MAG: carbohydrate kinase family protein [Anaerolineales bacterium]|nr:carbohydrate kinase family protein [Anaerolineales bacterium]
MSKIVISGLINIETTLKTDQFPLIYAPVRYPFFGIRTTVSGVGYNIAKALTRLNESISFLSLIGKDFAGDLVCRSLKTDNIAIEYILADMPETAQSVIIYDREGQRQIHTDLKDIQERIYPRERFAVALAESDLAILCNINFSRPFLQYARQANKTIATDVHAISSLEDAYNHDFMAAAHILFMSDELLPCVPELWAKQIQDEFGTPIIVIGLGAAGALLAVKDDGFMERVPAVVTRPVVNTIGAGDALFSAFTSIFHQTGDPYLAINKAVIFASYKIGSTGAADGFLTAAGLDELYEKVRVV